MKIIFFWVFITLISAGPKDEWISLLDKDMSQWETYLSFSHKNGYKGEPPLDAAGNIIQPLGYNVSGQKVFTVIEENGEPVLKVSGEIYGCAYTKQDFENYHLKLQVKWGENKWEPRLTKLKDSGILYHSIGKSGVDYWRSWMLSQEFQIMEGHMGDYWSIANSAIDIRAFISEGKMNSVANIEQPFIKFGKDGQEGLCLRSENHETDDDWTTLELICFEDKSLHVVNGKVVMVLRNSRYVEESGKEITLTKGKIQLQSEAAEIYFKNIQIKEIKEMPKNYQSYYNTTL